MAEGGRWAAERQPGLDVLYGARIMDVEQVPGEEVSGVLAWWTEKWSPSPVRVAERVYLDLQQALSEFRPDVLAIHWATFAQARLETLTRVGVPFAVRVHSFDFDPEVVAQIRGHPLWLGVWAYPHHARRVDGVRPLVALLTGRDAFPDRSEERTIVLSASAGLPKKDWAALVEAFAELARNGADCRIVVTLTDQHEDEPQIIRKLITQAEAPIILSVDVPHDQVLALLARTALVVYTIGRRASSACLVPLSRACTQGRR
jgi:hypothetical protein